jgi:nitrate/nitrite transporter NarK
MYLANLGGGACWAVPLELDSKQTGTISGVMNGTGNFAGIFGPISAGFLVAATGDWSLPFLVIAGVLLVGSLVFYFLVVPEPIERAEQVPELAAQGGLIPRYAKLNDLARK